MSSSARSTRHRRFALRAAPLAIALAAAFSPADARAVTYRWIDSGGGLWSEGAKWDQGQPPVAGSDVVLPDLGPTYLVTLDAKVPTLSTMSIETHVRFRMGTDLSAFYFPCSQSFTNAGEVLDASHTIASPLVRNLATGVITVRSGGQLRLTGSSLMNDGLIAVGPNGNSEIAIGPELFVSGTGEIVLSGDGAIVRYEVGSKTLIQLAGHTLRGAGHVLTALENHGTVIADGFLTIAGNLGPTSNDALMRSLPGGRLALHALNNAGGQIVVEGGTVEGSLDNTGGTIQIVAGAVAANVDNSGGNIHLTGASGTIANGPVSNAGGVIRADGTLLLDGIIVLGGTLEGPGAFVTQTQAQLTQITLAAGSALHMDGPTRVETSLHHDGIVTISDNLFGFGTVALTGSTPFTLTGGSLLGPGSFSHPPGHTITGHGTIAAPLDNDGALIAAGGTLQITADLANDGTASAASGILRFSGSDVANAGGSIVAAGGAVWIDADASVTGGTIRAEGGDVLLRAPTTRITGATLSRTGSSVFVNTGVATLNDVTLAPGAEVVNPGMILAGGAGITNRGLLRVAGELTFQPGAGLAGDGVLALEGGRLASAAGEVTNPAGHTLRGNGDLESKLMNLGLLQPGTSPGTLRIAGDFEQTASGRVEIELGGTAPGAWDRIEVSGHAAFDGTFALSILPGYTPAEGDAFPVISYRTHAGDFADYEGLMTGGAQALPILGSDALSIRFDEGALPVPGQPAPAALRLYAPSGGRGELVLEMPERADVVLEVFDVGGRRAWSDEAAREAGIHRWRASLLPAGAYFVAATIRSGRSVERRSARLIVLR